MHYFEAAPSPRLKPFIKCYWALEDDGSADSPPEPVIPDGCPEIVFNLADKFKRHKHDGEIERQPGSILVGQMRKHVTLQPTGKIMLFGIRFYPAGAYPFCGFAFSELTDRIESLDNIWGKTADRFEQRLNEASDFGERVRIANLELEMRLLDNVPDENLATIASGLIEKKGGLGSISELSYFFGISERQLERKFDEQIGLSPKMFSRIVRFQGVLRALKGNKNLNLLDLAIATGYYDQSHFIKEFKDFSGQTPLEFLAVNQQISGVFIG